MCVLRNVDVSLVAFRIVTFLSVTAITLNKLFYFPFFR